MAGGEGFEPPGRFHAHQFSRLPPSTTRPATQVFSAVKRQVELQGQMAAEENELAGVARFERATCGTKSVRAFGSLSKPRSCPVHSWLGRDGSNVRPPVPKTVALPAELRPNEWNEQDRTCAHLYQLSYAPKANPLYAGIDNQEMSVIQPRIPPPFSAEDSCPWSRPVGKTGRPGFPGLSD